MMSKTIDILIKNATIIDPVTKTTTKGSIGICNGRLVEYHADESYTIHDELDAEGYYVSPGWIDSHTHIFKDGTEPGFAADLGLIPMGVTSAIDGGSAGVATWPLFKREVVDACYLNIFYSINVSPAGQITERYPENVDPQHYDIDALKNILTTDSRHARGLKLRYGAEVVEPFGNKVLDKTIELAGILRCPITIHVTNPPCPMEDIVSKMRPGDVVCHIYQGKGSTILDQHGNVKETVLQARKRGVYFDSADARINHSYKVMKPAIAQGFTPDIISTDLTKNGIFTNMCWGLPVVLSKWLNLGLPLEEVIADCTCHPAKIHHLPDGIGTIQPGAAANLTIFSVAHRPFHLKNRMGEEFDGEKMILPQVTIINGKIRYKNLAFPF
ncbi:MAG: amidohydrolase family protein [Megasphaera sp.]|jgi:dihydroorotase|nr:amidohydrolase family protein [Megasphaera sp.]MCH4187382.1 amidohydrolase family protein [Megasphaera sp.]MCH4217564.1 amidohydrolase family protein [Megasphaera sp.]